MNEAPTIRTRRIEKPLGVYIMTGYDFLALGLVPLIALVIALRVSDEEVPFVIVVFSVGLHFAVMGASVWALTGDNIGRIFLLTVVSITALLWILNAAITLSTHESENFRKLSVIGYIIRGITALALNWWYFNRKNVFQYYRQNR